MTASDDPAVDAAQRAWAVHYDRDSFQMSAEGNGFASRMTAAAREALAPIRELIEKWTEPTTPGAFSNGNPDADTHTARAFIDELCELVYRKDELT